MGAQLASLGGERLTLASS